MAMIKVVYFALLGEEFSIDNIFLVQVNYFMGVYFYYFYEKPSN